MNSKLQDQQNQAPAEKNRLNAHNQIAVKQLADRLATILASQTLSEEHRVPLEKWLPALDGSKPEALSKLIAQLHEANLWELGNAGRESDPVAAQEHQEREPDTNPRLVPEDAPAAQSCATAGVSNAQFASVIFGQLPNDHLIAVTSFPDYEKPNWPAKFGRPENLPDRPKSNSYFAPSSLTGNGRDLDHFAGLHVVVLDDITPGVLAKLPEPTYALETSVENYQVGYALHPTVTDLSMAQRIHQALQSAGYCDSNGNNPVRWARLPVGMNTKPGKMFAHKLQVWEPGRRFEPMALVGLLKLNLKAETPGNAKTSDTFANMPEPKLQAPGALASLLQKLDPDMARDDWRKVISCIYHHLGESGYALAHDWSSKGEKYMLTPEHRKITSLKTAESAFHKVWDQIAADTGFRMGPGALFDIMQKQHTKTSGKFGMSPADIAQWHKTALSEVEGNASKIITWGNDLQMTRVEWFWKNRLAIGMFHLLGGTPGTGKSTIAFTWAAIISAGGLFPDGERAPKGKVLIWSGEDSYESTIKPRLVAAGADMTNIGFLNQPLALKDGTKVDFNPADHLPALMAEIEAMPKGEVSMLIIDPIVTVIGGKDNNSTSEVRAALAPLVAMLNKLGIIGLGIMHFTKGSESKDPQDRFNGSSGYIALARVGFAVVKDQNEDGRHLLTVAKSNIGPEGGGYNYHIEQAEVTDPKVGVIETSKVIWGDTLEGDARELIREAEVIQRDRPANKLQQAKAFLREMLSAGPRLVDDIEKAAEDANIGWRTVETAKREIGVVSERSDPDDNRSLYQWRIPVMDFDDVANAVNS